MIKSEINKFYIGDPCYVLGDKIYFDIWSKKFNFNDGYIEVKKNSGFEVHGTCYGDGEYKDEQGNKYPVDSGSLAVIPLEICSKPKGLNKGRVVNSSNASLDYKDGLFTIKLDNGEVVIDTDLEVTEKEVDNESVNIRENKLQEGYIEDEQALAKDYEERVINNMPANARESFKELKEILDDETHDTSVDGFYFPAKAVAVLENTEQYHLNGYMDLTVSNILNMVDDCDTIEEAIHQLFVDYNPDSAFSWADNFVTVLDKLDFDISEEDSEELDYLDESKLNVNDIINNFKKKVADEHIHVTEDDINEYMTDLFTDDMETEEDMDAMNEAEGWLRNYYGIDVVDDDIDETDWQAEYEAEATERFEDRYMNGGNGFTSDIKDECTQVSNVGSDRVSVFGSDAGNKFVHPSDIYKELYELKDYDDAEVVSEQKQSFIDYCKDKIKDLGEVEIDGNTYKVIMHTPAIRQFNDIRVITQLDADTDEDLICIDKDNNIVIDTPMMDYNSYAAAKLFDEIDKEYYNLVIKYWNDIDMDSYTDEEDL